jgi:hypothetical protein
MRRYLGFLGLLLVVLILAAGVGMGAILLGSSPAEAQLVDDPNPGGGGGGSTCPSTCQYCCQTNCGCSAVEGKAFVGWCGCSSISCYRVCAWADR